MLILHDYDCENNEMPAMVTTLQNNDVPFMLKSLDQNDFDEYQVSKHCLFKSMKPMR